MDDVNEFERRLARLRLGLKPVSKDSTSKTRSPPDFVANTNNMKKKHEIIVDTLQFEKNILSNQLKTIERSKKILVDTVNEFKSSIEKKNKEKHDLYGVLLKLQKRNLELSQINEETRLDCKLIRINTHRAAVMEQIRQARRNTEELEIQERMELLKKLKETNRLPPMYPVRNKEPEPELDDNQGLLNRFLRVVRIRD